MSLQPHNDFISKGRGGADVSLDNVYRLVKAIPFYLVSTFQAVSLIGFLLSMRLCLRVLTREANIEHALIPFFKYEEE